MIVACRFCNKPVQIPKGAINECIICKYIKDFIHLNPEPIKKILKEIYNESMDSIGIYSL